MPFVLPLLPQELNRVAKVDKTCDFVKVGFCRLSVVFENSVC